MFFFQYEKKFSPKQAYFTEFNRFVLLAIVCIIVLAITQKTQSDWWMTKNAQKCAKRTVKLDCKVYFLDCA